jgi:molybdopterin-binding protein
VTLDVDITVDRGAFAVRVRFEAAPGSVIAIVGPNGAGKTSLLRGIAGLTPATGRIAVDGADLAAVPAQRRGVGWVPQDGALFPHLSARDNVAFGIGGRSARTDANRWLDALGVGELADRRPAQLSGGQAQKVALARALARCPRVLLLDEPLAALDAQARSDVRRALREHLAAFDGVTLLVTHDPVDAMALADRVVAIEDGTIVQDATPAEVARAPRSAWLGRLIGVNAYRGRLVGTRLALDGGGELSVADSADDVDAIGVIAPHAVTLHRTRPESSARNTWPVTVTELAGHGHRVRVRCDGQPDVVAEVTPEAVGALSLTEGARAWASVKATEITVVLL